AVHVRVAGRPQRPQPEPVGQAQSQRSERARMQEIAPTRAVAKLGRAVRIQSKHGPSLVRDSITAVRRRMRLVMRKFYIDLRFVRWILRDTAVVLASAAVESWFKHRRDFLQHAPWQKELLETGWILAHETSLSAQLHRL